MSKYCKIVNIYPREIKVLYSILPCCLNVLDVLDICLRGQPIMIWGDPVENLKRNFFPASVSVKISLDISYIAKVKNKYTMYVKICKQMLMVASAVCYPLPGSYNHNPLVSLEET